MLKRASVTTLILLAFATTASAATWNIDKAHSSVGFSVRHMVISKVPGKFTDFDGTIEATRTTDGNLALGTARVTMTVQAASVDTDNADRDKHLRGDDFFDAANYPELTFVSKEIIQQDNGKFQLIGDLTIRGVTKQVTFDGAFNGMVTDPWGNTKAGFSAVGTINRQDFGVSWSKALDTGGLVVSDNVDIILDIQAVMEDPSEDPDQVSSQRG